MVRSILRRLALSVLGVLMLVASARASLIPVTLQFTDPAWSGAVSFDDTTGVPWMFFPALTAFEVTDMAVSNGVSTWTEEEIDAGSGPPFGELVVDAAGRVALFLTARDAPTDSGLGGGLSNTLDGLITFTSLDSTPRVDGGVYTAFLPTAVTVPRTLWLVASGLAGLGGVAWRRRR